MKTRTSLRLLPVDGHGSRRGLRPALPAFGLAGILALAWVGRAWGEPPHPHEPEYVPEAEPRERPTGEEAPERRMVPQQGGMLRIPGGEFSMGYDGPPPGEPNERPVHVVKVAPFWIDRTEVTAEAMRACIDRGDCALRLGKGPECTIDRPEAKLPINCVPWQSADAYCRAVGKRLPTEAEWELAAGGGPKAAPTSPTGGGPKAAPTSMTGGGPKAAPTSMPGGQKARFPWGARLPSCKIAVTLVSNRSGASCSPHGPAPVGSHPKGESAFGVQDMAGNVEEWVADWYADRYEVVSPLTQAGGSVPSATGPAFGVAHVLRGGGWMSRPRETRVTARSWGSPNEAGSNVGFRCAKD